MIEQGLRDLWLGSWNREPVSASDVTEAGEHAVMLYAVGARRAEVAAVLELVCPGDAQGVLAAVDGGPPVVVRQGLSHAAARSVRNHLRAVGAHAVVASAQERAILVA